MPISRRKFLAATGAAGALAATGRLATGVQPAGATLPTPSASGIEHIVVLVMENRSFDHYLGWAPGANGTQSGLNYPDDLGVNHPTHQLMDWTGCGFNDPDHGYAGGRVQYNGGACDGFRKSPNDDYAIGYYVRSQLPTNSALVDKFTICDNYFSSILGPTFPNRFYTHAAQTDRLDNALAQSTLTTIWDRLAAANVSANYYFSDEPFLALWANKYLSIGRHVETFFAQAATGTLPHYSYIDPFFIGEDQGGSNDDHPHADIRRGQAFIARVVNAVMRGPKWHKTVLVITYDEWGGFFDHVAPPSLPDAFTPTATEEHNRAGFRVPTYVVSPFARPGAVATGQYDHSSILKMVEWRWGLASLTARDAAANNLADTLDFSYCNPASCIPQPADPGPDPCVPPVLMGNREQFWDDLRHCPLTTAWHQIPH
ncbi:MAG TPA: alkaline phosphatase family protein [Acidimicrobiales bacterium]|jgi:phospholipase C|nr:alkaline phosphatase family protein [Acidimicrobiales bacterium]